MESCELVSCHRRPDANCEALTIMLMLTERKKVDNEVIVEGVYCPEIEQMLFHR